MRVLVLRTVLAGVLLATAADRIARAGAPQSDIRSTVISLAARKGWSPQEIPSASTDPLGRGISFRAAGCDERGQIFFVDLNLQAAPMLDHAIGPGYTRYITYLGRTWTAQDRLGLRLEWLRQKALSTVGLGEYAVNETALVIAEPKGCRIADKVDWGAAWRRSNGTL